MNAPIDVFDTKLPNSDPRFFSLREALESEEYKQAKTPLSFPIGRDESGKFIIADFHTFPHMIAGGQTGSGKSNFTEGTLVASLVYRNSPEDLKLILVDPKWVQFPQYEGIPHLLRPIITTPEAAKEAMEFLLDEMQDRFDTLAGSGKRDIVEYNKSADEHMPYILYIVDEVADLMMDDGEYYQASFIKLLQKAKAVGIHLYIGTSRPSEDVYPGLLRANFVSSIAFKCASKVDSEKMLYEEGAENLLGQGDALLYTPDNSRPVHLQVPYVSDANMMALAEAVTS